MTNITNLFSAAQNASNSSRGLTGTAQLVALTNSISDQIINLINSDAEQYVQQLEASKSDHDAMDNLIQQFEALTGADYSFMDELDDSVLEQMLKSQQSKRSRCKSKQMTFENYKSMMSAACAEWIIRQVTGKTKHAGGYNRGGQAIGYTIEQIDQLAADQDRLRAEIRNIQSKKSIMKSKAGFDPSSDRWQELLKAEQMLKDLRVGKTQQVVKVDETKQQLNELLGGVDVEHLKAADSKELLAKIASLMAAEATEE